VLISSSSHFQKGGGFLRGFNFKHLTIHARQAGLLSSHSSLA
jgi:hypothetical protein